MPDGPNYEEVFKRMDTLHGGDAESVKTITRWLRFFKDQEGYEMYLNHYLPMLPPEVAKEFAPEKVESKNEPSEKAEVAVTEPKKKRGRKAKSPTA